MGSGSTDVQRMSAGAGAMRGEFNASNEEGASAADLGHADVTRHRTGLRGKALHGCGQVRPAAGDRVARRTRRFGGVDAVTLERGNAAEVLLFDPG
jgi:hypothetical protein